MHHFPPFQPNPKGTSTTSISTCAPNTPPPSPPSYQPSPSSSSPRGWRAADAGDTTPRPRRRETPAGEDPCSALPIVRAPRRRDGQCFRRNNGAVVPTLAEIEDEVRRHHDHEAAERRRPVKRTRCQAPVDAVSRPLSPPPSPPSSSCGWDEGVGAPTTTAPPLVRRVAARPQGEPVSLLRSALRTPSSASSSSSSTSPPSKSHKTVHFATTAPETQFFARWDAPSSLNLLRRTPERAVPKPDGDDSGDGPLPPSPPPAWHWTLRTPDLVPPTATDPDPVPAAAVVRLRDLFLGARRRPSTVLGLVSVARRRSMPTTTPPGTVVCEATRDRGRTWATAVPRAGAAGWFCAAPRCDWFQFALDADGLGLFGNDDAVDGQEEEEATASNPRTSNNTLALRVRYRDEEGRQWVDDNHGAGFEVRFELCRAGPVDKEDKYDVNDVGRTPEEELGWDE